jgi:hypothetical protein
MSNSKTRVATLLVAVASFALLGAGRYRPHAAAVPGESAPETWEQNSFDGASDCIHTPRRILRGLVVANAEIRNPRTRRADNQAAGCYDSRTATTRQALRRLHGESFMNPIAVLPSCLRIS